MPSFWQLLNQIAGVDRTDGSQKMSDSVEEKVVVHDAKDDAKQSPPTSADLEQEKPAQDDEDSDSSVDRTRPPNANKANKILGRTSDANHDIEKQGNRDAVEEVDSAAGYGGNVGANTESNANSGLPKGCEEKDGIILVGWAGDDDPDYPYNWTTKKKWTNGGLLSFMTFITYDAIQLPCYGC